MMCYEDFFYSKRNFNILTGIILIFIFFRYGIGVDYFNYLYAIWEGSLGFENFIETGNYNGRYEIGFSAICYVWSLTGINNLFLISIYACASFYMISRFALRYSPKPIASILYFFSFFFLVYTFSALRQGVSLGIFCAFALPSLLQRKYLKFYFFIFLMMLFHKSSAYLIILPFLLKIKLTKLNISILMFSSFILSFVMKYLLTDTIGQFAENYTDDIFGYDYASIILRVFLAVIILSLFEPLTSNNNERKFFEIYFIGLFIYLILSFNSIISSRITIYLRIVEIILMIFVLSKKFVRIPKLSVLAVTFFLFIKTINTEIAQASYYRNVSILTFPYVTIFNTDAIYEYRPVTFETNF